MVPASAVASPASICDATAGNLVLNCGFELAPFGAGVTPTDWTTSQWLDEEDIESGVLNSGNWALRIANDPGQGGPLFDGAAILSQNFADTAGATYQFSFYLIDGDGSSTSDPTDLQFNAYWDSTSGTPVFTDNGGGSPALGWTQESFSVTGTGSDTITFTSVNGPNWYYLDDVSVVETAGPSSTPEPASMFLMALGIAGLAVFAGFRRKTQPNQ
jgi:hypothetical protein